jgi:hypothetical protein
MHTRTTPQLIAAFAAACLFFIQPSSPTSPDSGRQAPEGRTLEVQLSELSALISKSSGVEQHFVYHVDQSGGVTIINDKPEEFVHIFRLNNSRQLDFELRELRDVRFLADYTVEGATPVRVSNPIKDSNRYALVALHEIDSGWDDPPAISDLTSLASVADEPLELNGYMQHDQEGNLISPKGGRATYNALKYLRIDRVSLRNQGGSLRFNSDQIPSWTFLDIEDNWPDVDISYAPMFPCTPYLAEQLTKRVSRQELLRQNYKKLIVHKHYTSTYRGRAQGINKVFRHRRFVDLVLFEQTLRYENGVWRVEQQAYSVVKPIQCSQIFFERIGKRLLITGVYP